MTLGEKQVEGSTGFALRFDVDPRALEGQDFLVLDEGESNGTPHLLWLTKKTLTLRDRSLVTSENAAEAVRLWLAAAREGQSEVVDLLERRLQFLGLDLGDAQLDALVAAVEAELTALERPANQPAADAIWEPDDSSSLVGEALSRLLRLRPIVAQKEWPTWVRRFAALPRAGESVFAIFQAAEPFLRPEGKALFTTLADELMERIRPSASRAGPDRPQTWGEQDRLLFLFQNVDFLRRVDEWPTMAIDTIERVGAGSDVETKFAASRMASWTLRLAEAQAHRGYLELAKELLRLSPNEWQWLFLPPIFRSAHGPALFEALVEAVALYPQHFGESVRNLAWLLRGDTVASVDVPTYHREIATTLNAWADEISLRPGMAAKVVQAKASQPLSYWFVMPPLSCGAELADERVRPRRK